LCKCLINCIFKFVFPAKKADVENTAPVIFCGELKTRIAEIVIRKNGVIDKLIDGSAPASAFPIPIPPLRERKMDIPLLVTYFLHKKSMELGIHTIPALAPDAIDRLSAHSWPGNVRELENAVESALIKHRQGPLFFHRSFELPEKDIVAIPLKQTSRPLTLDDAMRHHIRQTLALASGKVNGPDGAAALLGLHPNTLRNRMKKLSVPFGRRHAEDESMG